MLRKRDLNDVPVLFDLMSHPEVYPYVREKCDTVDEFYFKTKKLIESDESGEIVTRTILDDFLQPVGTISLFDVEGSAGFLATWIGQPFFGKGYSKTSKEEFFDELFTETPIDTVYLKIRKENIRSRKSTTKLPYTSLANESHKHVYDQINENGEIFDLFVVEKDHYLALKQFIEMPVSQTTEEGYVG
ncbi:GNAT family protein [Aciduricibacillus chroicocephali]|uniref:GNAT family protein n=1 Tax=Aciduricibacillus chroicocephali TaxID=3054939 RepID=A0ABY9KX28_9BACI|nr:GNAT family protein [Bacillaceae bacterium 44XB]